MDEDDIPLQNWRKIIEAALASVAGSTGESVESSTSQSQIATLSTTSVLSPSYVPPTLSENSNIADYLKAANEVESHSPVVAQMLSRRAYELARELDPDSEGRGVLQFKTFLRANLVDMDEQRDVEEELRQLKMCQEIHLSRKEALEFDPEQNREAIARAMITHQVLLKLKQELLPAHVSATIATQVAEELASASAQTSVISHQKYNILPLGIQEADEPVMDLPQVKAALDALSDTHHLPRDPRTGRQFPHVLAFLGYVFCFQEDNVRNQWEHLALLLANSFTRSKSSAMSWTPAGQDSEQLLTKAVEELFLKLTGNFTRWAQYLDISTSYLEVKPEGTIWHMKLCYVALYLLMWGEAANVRFLPECLCYLFHCMAHELDSEILSKEGAIRSKAMPEEGGEFAFLEGVITPIYTIIKAEADSAGHGLTSKGHHSWRNYDDLNEYFWSKECLELSWPMDLGCRFFTVLTPRNDIPKYPLGKEAEAAALKANQNASTSRGARVPGASKKQKSQSKSQFVEWRTFWHVFHSFHRLWIFLFVMLQALIIIAFGDPKKGRTLQVLLSIFPTIAVLQLVQASADILMTWYAYNSLKASQVLRKFARLAIAIAWATCLSIFCINMLQEKQSGSRPWLTLYALLVALYVAPRFFTSVTLRLAFLRTGADRVSHWRIARFLKWFYLEEVYVGRGMYESTSTVAAYSLFWFALLVFKFLFSYYFQVQPMVVPTRYIINYVHVNYTWHDLVSQGNHNVITLLSLWMPIVTIYLLDISIWYTVMSALGGGIIGATWHLGEIRTLKMLRARFSQLAVAYALKLQPLTTFGVHSSGRLSSSISAPDGEVDSAIEQNSTPRFAPAWNEIILAMREEDYLSNRERDLLLLPTEGARLVDNTVGQLPQLPLFLLANQIHLALKVASEHTAGSDQALWDKITKDKFMIRAVQEAYVSVRLLLLSVMTPPGSIGSNPEARVIDSFFGDVANTLAENRFSSAFNLKNIRTVHNKLTKLTEVLVKPETDDNLAKAVEALQDLYEVATKDFLNSEDQRHDWDQMLSQDAKKKYALQPFSNVKWPNFEAANRLHLLLTMKESVLEVPRNLEARRRLQFFSNSLFMNMPAAPKVEDMVPFCVLTPYYSEIVLYSKKELLHENEDGISTLFYLQKIFPDEWDNLEERMKLKRGTLSATVDLKKESPLDLDLRLWASYRGQTLTRTVRGMMYYRRALQLLISVEGGQGDIEQGSDVERVKSDPYNGPRARALADMKFTYVVACQIYGTQRLKKDPKADDILRLLKENPALRVACIDEVDVKKDASGRSKTSKEYYARLLKVDKYMQEQDVFKVKLPGPAKLGEGKPENQNNAIIFTRGDALQTIDMNQDNYLEEALKMRNLLEEFRRHHGLRKPTILGVREHIFTGSVSSLAWFMSNQETSFVTLGQRFMAWPLKIRMHYGHPDVFDRLFHITRGGISKASKLINISEDIYAGFNTTLRQGNVSHHEYIQVGKGRDVGLNQIAIFEGKVAGGNGEQVLSRDIFRLGQLFEFFRMCSFFYTSVGFYICTMLTVWCVYFFLYGKCYLALSGMEETLKTRADILGNTALESALNTQFLLQIGVFTAVPMIVGFVLEQGLAKAVLSFMTMQLQLASVFFTFSLGTRTHYFGRTIMHGGAKYGSTGRGFVVVHEKFAENYRLYSRSHFVKGLEVALLLVVYLCYGAQTGTSYILLALSSWIMAFSWCFAPFLFNPSGFEWQKTVQDFDDWTNWLFFQGGIGVDVKQSWEAWWEGEVSHIRTFRSVVLELLLSTRFFFFQYGVAYKLHAANGSTSIFVYVVSCMVLGALLLLVALLSSGRMWEAQLIVRLVKASALLGSLLLLVLLVAFTNLTVGDIFASILGLLPTGYGLLQIGIALQVPLRKVRRLWKIVMKVARLYDTIMGSLLFFPIAFLSWFPFVNTFQTRLVFNQAFSRGLEISLILSGNKPNQD